MRHTGTYTPSKFGFTLVETLVAVSILLVVIVGPMSIASQGLKNAYFAGDQTTAVYLAQESLEHIIRLRDNVALLNYEDFKSDGNVSDGDGDTGEWYGDLSASCRGASGCDYDTIEDGYKNCGVTDACTLSHYRGDPSTAPAHLYAYVSPGSDWEESPYTRVIHIGAPVEGSGTRLGGVPVTVTVSWDASRAFGAGTTKTVTLQTYIYDHYTRFE